MERHADGVEGRGCPEAVTVASSIPSRIRFAERRANERGEDGGAIVKAWLAAVKAGTEKDFVVPLK